MAAPMPRDPPVTRATFPAREANSDPLGSAEGLLKSAQSFGVAHGDRLQRAVAAAQEAAQDLPGSDLDEYFHALSDQPAHGLSEGRLTGLPVSTTYRVDVNVVGAAF